MKERIEYIDVLRGIAILLVIYSHLLQLVLVPMPAQSAINQVFVTFRMPLFFLISGFFVYSPAYRLPLLRRRIANRLTRQLYPTAVLFILCMAIFHDANYGKILLEPGKYGYWFTLTAVELFLVVAPLLVVFSLRPALRGRAKALLCLLYLLLVEALLLPLLPGQPFGPLTPAVDRLNRLLGLHLLFEYLPFFIAGMIFHIGYRRLEPLLLHPLTAVGCLLLYVPLYLWADSFHLRLFGLGFPAVALCLSLASLSLRRRSWASWRGQTEVWGLTPRRTPMMPDGIIRSTGRTNAEDNIEQALERSCGALERPSASRTLRSRTLLRRSRLPGGHTRQCNCLLASGYASAASLPGERSDQRERDAGALIRCAKLKIESRHLALVCDSRCALQSKMTDLNGEMQGAEEELAGSIHKVCDQERLPMATQQIAHFHTPTSASGEPRPGFYIFLTRLFHRRRMPRRLRVITHRLKSFLLRLGSSTLEIYLLHYFIIYFIRFHLDGEWIPRSAGTPWEFPLILALSIAVAVGCLLIVWLLRQLRLYPLLFGAKEPCSLRFGKLRYRTLLRRSRTAHAGL